MQESPPSGSVFLSSPHPVFYRTLFLVWSLCNKLAFEKIGAFKHDEI